MLSKVLLAMLLPFTLFQTAFAQRSIRLQGDTIHLHFAYLLSL